MKVRLIAFYFFNYFQRFCKFLLKRMICRYANNSKHFFFFFFLIKAFNYTLVRGEKCFVFDLKTHFSQYDICNIVDVSHVFLLSQSIKTTWNIFLFCKLWKNLANFFSFTIKNTIYYSFTTVYWKLLIFTFLQLSCQE